MVNASDRGHGKLEALVKAKRLASYTIKITCNQKTFPVQYYNAITYKIIAIATQIFMDAWEANGIRVEDDEDKHKERHALQDKAIRGCNNLLPLIQIAQEVFHLRLRRIEHWGRLILETRSILKAWQESDDKRFTAHQVGVS